MARSRFFQIDLFILCIGSRSRERQKRSRSRSGSYSSRSYSSYSNSRRKYIDIMIIY